jgi:hypothetical protein
VRTSTERGSSLATNCTAKPNDEARGARNNITRGCAGGWSQADEGSREVETNLHAFDKPDEGTQELGPIVGAAAGKDGRFLHGERVAEVLEQHGDLILCLDGVPRVERVHFGVDELKDANKVSGGWGAQGLG